MRAHLARNVALVELFAFSKYSAAFAASLEASYAPPPTAAAADRSGARLSAGSSIFERLRGAPAAQVDCASTRRALRSLGARSDHFPHRFLGGGVGPEPGVVDEPRKIEAREMIGCNPQHLLDRFLAHAPDRRAPRRRARRSRACSMWPGRELFHALELGRRACRAGLRIATSSVISVDAQPDVRPGGRFDRCSSVAIASARWPCAIWSLALSKHRFDVVAARDKHLVDELLRLRQVAVPGRPSAPARSARGSFVGFAAERASIALRASLAGYRAPR